MSTPDTIFALASARGRAGVAVIRVSGPLSDNAITALLGQSPLPPYRVMALRKLSDPRDAQLLDEALVVRFARGASFTGEDGAEFHCHGGPAVIAAILDAVGSMDDVREAEPGEFTRRAFDNGCLDLAQIEGLSDLIASETDAQRRAALRHTDGSLGRQCREWSAALTKALALLEATIDFADEDIPDGTYALVTAESARVRLEIETLLRGSALSDRFRDGWRIALIGAPNAGKSSLINALTRRDVAITSPLAGTTRDAIEVSLDLNGYPVTLVDTAGLRLTEDAIEAEGVIQTQKQAETADLRIALAAVDAPLTQEVSAALEPTDLQVWNKTDLSSAPPGFDLAISVKESERLDTLVAAIAKRLSFIDPSDASALLRRRHDTALRECVQALDDYAALAENPHLPLKEAPEIASEHLRLARAALGSITGDVGVERLLDVIFSEFCLGK